MQGYEVQITLQVLGPGNDDPSYGFLYEAKQIYDWIWDNGWDKNVSCDGGFWFDQVGIVL